MEVEGGRRFSYTGVNGLWGPSLESRERKKRKDRRFKQELDAQIKFREEIHDKQYAGPYGDFLVTEKISQSPAPIKESLIVPPLHRTVDNGNVEPWKAWDEEKFGIEQKRKMRWESFRDLHNLPPGEIGRNNKVSSRFDSPNSPKNNQFARSPLTHKPMEYQLFNYNTGSNNNNTTNNNNNNGSNMYDVFNRGQHKIDYQKPLWEIDGNLKVNRAAQISPIRDKDEISATTVSLDSCRQVQRAFHALDENRQGVLHEAEIKRLCSLYFIPPYEVDLALQRSSTLKSYSKGIIRYNTFLKNLCPALFADDSNSKNNNRRKNNYQKRKERAVKIWYPWGGSGGGAPVRDGEGRPIADRTEMRRNAGYRIQRGGLMSIDQGNANSPGAPMYLSGSMGKYFYKEDANNNNNNNNSNNNKKNEIKKSPIRANLNRHPISDFLDPYQNQDIELQQSSFMQSNNTSYRPVRARVVKRNKRRVANAQNLLDMEEKPAKLLPNDVRYNDEEMIMRKVVQNHEALPEPEMLPSSNARLDQEKGSLSLMNSIPSYEMSSWPKGLKFEEETEEVKEIFNSPFRGFATTPSDEGSMNSEQRQELLTQYSSIRQPLQKSFAFEPNANDSSYDKFIDAARSSMFIEA